MHSERHHTESFLGWGQKCRFTSHRHRTTPPHLEVSKKGLLDLVLATQLWEKGQHAWQSLWMQQTLTVPGAQDPAPHSKTAFNSGLQKPPVLPLPSPSPVPSDVEGSSCPEMPEWAGCCVCLYQGTQPLAQCAAGMQLHLMFWPTKVTVTFITQRSKEHLGSIDQRLPCFVKVLEPGRKKTDM